MLISSDLKNNYGFDFHHRSDILNTNKIARILIPKQKISNSIPICYLLPPFATNRFFWLKCLKELYDDSKLPFAIVMPESYRNWFINDAGGFRYEDYFINELIPKIEVELANYVNIGKRIIGGFSMGGASAIFLGLRYPSLFKMLFSISGAFDAANRDGDPYKEYRDNMELMIPTIEEHEKVWGPLNSAIRSTYNITNLLSYLDPKKFDKKIIMEVGCDDYERIVNMNREAHNIFNDYGFFHHYSEYKGGHNGRYAKESIERMIKLWDSN